MKLIEKILNYLRSLNEDIDRYEKMIEDDPEQMDIYYDYLMYRNSMHSMYF